MASSPVFITSYEILRSRDYVLLTFNSPTGEVVDGTMQTVEMQHVALTIPRFLELAGAMFQIARSIEASAQPRLPANKRSAPSISDKAEGSDGGLDEVRPADWVVRH